jgi:hypothetical protein
MKSLYEAYQDVYCYDESSFYGDIVNFCEELNIFEHVEESEYFASLIIENDLSDTFIDDILEYCNQEQLLDESYIAEVSTGLIKAGLKAAGGVLKKVTPAVRGMSAKTLAKKGYTPGGFGKTGKILNPQARATQTRAIQQARAARKPPAPEAPNKYADMLAQKRASSSGGSFVQKGWERHTAAGGPSPQKIAQRAAADPTILATMLGVAQMAGLPVSKAISGVSRAAAPIASTVKNVGQKVAPAARKVAGAAADPWMQFMKGSKPKQYGLPREGPSSPLPGRFLPKPSPEPKGLLPAAKNTAGKSMASSNTQSLAKMPKGATKPSGNISQPEFGSVGKSMASSNTQTLAKMPKGTPRPSGGITQPTFGGTTGKSMARSNSQNIAKAPKGTPKPSGGITQPTFGGTKPNSPYRHTSSRGRAPFRATGPSGGNPTLERLASQSATSKKGGIPRKPALGAAAATVAGAGAILGADQMNKKQQKYDVYNTKDPSGTIRSRLNVGSKIVGPKIVGGAALGPAKDFEDAFRKNREFGKKTFKYGSGEYTTQLAKEEFYSDIMYSLLSEGYANDEKSAHEIINSMSDEWLYSILKSTN